MLTHRARCCLPSPQCVLMETLREAFAEYKTKHLFQPHAVYEEVRGGGGRGSPLSGD